jgi:hypothetical protein
LIIIHLLCYTDFQFPVATPSLSGKPVQESLTGCNKTLVTEWSVQEVLDWLKRRGFDQDVCNKFIGKSNYYFLLNKSNIIFLDNEITGEVLLKLDVDLLKSEIGIMAFGKRTQIMKSIADLCQLPSVTCSNDQLQFNHSTPQSQSASQPESYLHMTVQGPNHRRLFVEKFNMPALCLLLLVLGMLGLLLRY